MRVVSLVPSATETLFDLGVGQHLVGCTRYCVEPEVPLRKVPRVGGTKNPDLEQIAALQPDLVLANREENREEHIGWLQERLPVYESMPRTLTEAAAFVREVGRRLDAVEAAEAIVLEIQAQLARAEVETVFKKPVRVFYAIWKKPWMAINADTYIHDLLRHAGAENVTAHLDARYPVVSPQELRGLAAELVVLPNEPFAFNAFHKKEVLELQLFGPEVPVVLVDGKDFCWHGSRSGRGLAAAIDVLQPFRGSRGQRAS